jgi:hypothetical protein
VLEVGDSAWFNVMRELQARPDRYRLLNAAQLVFRF